MTRSSTVERFSSTGPWLIAGLCIVLVGLSEPLAPGDHVGVLILAHGGTERWNRTVEETVELAQLAYPTEVAFGMGMHVEEVARLQRAIDRLEGQGVRHVVAVPLLVSSASQVIRQFQYLLGLRDHGPWEEVARPVTVGASVVMTDPLDDDPAVATVLLERALDLSRDPEHEAVVIVAHGPSSPDDNVRWLSVMERLARRIKVAGKFRAVDPVTMQDDAHGPILDEATRRMRAVVRRRSLEGRVLVVPLLIASGGVEGKIPERLEGLEYDYLGIPLLPHPEVAQWIARQVEVAVPK